MQFKTGMIHFWSVIDIWKAKEDWGGGPCLHSHTWEVEAGRVRSWRTTSLGPPWTTWNPVQRNDHGTAATYENLHNARWGAPGHPSPFPASDLHWPICSHTAYCSQDLRKETSSVLDLSNVFSASSTVCLPLLPRPLLPFPKSVAMFHQQLKSFFH